MTDEPDIWWDEAYETDETPWDLGRPQRAVAELAEAGAISGRVLDVGCGRGTHAFYLAERGHDVTGIDASAVAVEQARANARERDAERPGTDSADELAGDVTFRVADALALDPDLGPFDTVLDSGLFHVFEADDRATYADSLAGVLRSGGRAFVLSFGADAPDDWGPNPISPADVRAAFGDDWDVRTIRAEPFETTAGDVPGLLAVVERR